jgi:hypothetical protein
MGIGENDMDQPKKPEQEQERKSEQKKIPTPGDLFRAYQQGGVEKLKEMLPDVPDDEEN